MDTGTGLATTDVLDCLLPHFRDKIRHLGLTGQGEPVHPLYMRKLTTLKEFADAVFSSPSTVDRGR